MRRILRNVQVGLITLILAAFGVTLSQAKPDYTKKEKKSCVTCHTKAGSKELNKVGKCYEEKKSLEKCTE